MPETGPVAHPPERPFAIFDGDCGFCRLWIARWKEATGPKVDYAPSDEVAGRFPEIPREALARAFQLVLPNGEVREGAAAVLGALETAGRLRPAAWAYHRVPGFAPVLELAYRAVASHRGAAMAATRLLWGADVLRPTYRVANALFLRLLGLCYVVAFVSLGVQVAGLVGSNGILPAAEFLEWARGQTGAERYAILPTLCWAFSSNLALQTMCGAGAAAGLLLLAGFVPAWSAAVAWVLYLSLSVAGQIFLEFQWDLLLLEAGLLAVFLAPPGALRLRSGLEAPRLARFLPVWLLFRLMLLSGAVKLLGGDPTWRSLTALRVYYETQPLPPWTAWFAHALPASFQTASCIFVFFVELAMPFLFFAPRRLRHFACGMTVLLQLLIAATGNYAFFNLLTVALAMLLLDDRAMPRRLRTSADAAPSRGHWPRAVLIPVATALLAASAVPFLASLGLRSVIPGPLVSWYRLLAPFRSANGYGLFAVMTTSRPEIQVEGSADGIEWKAYEFKWKPGAVDGRPRFVAPHQPRLDWQMWFAALGPLESNRWVVRFLTRLLEGSPDVETLLAVNPFPREPPRYVRAVLYDYRFTTPAQRRETGAWWSRRELGNYSPVLGGR